MTPKAILLDALGTLVALEPPAPHLRAELRGRFELVLSEAASRQAIEAEIAFYRAHLDEGRDAAGVAALRRRCAQVLRNALPPEVRGRAADLPALTDALLAALRFDAHADAAPALARWRGQGIRLVVVSNWDASLHEVLERVGLRRLLDGALTSAEAGVRKPSPAIFERALSIAGVGPADAVHVGDSLEEDVAGARAAGIEPVLLRRHPDPTQPAVAVRTVSTLAELAP